MQLIRLSVEGRNIYSFVCLRSRNITILLSFARLMFLALRRVALERRKGRYISGRRHLRLGERSCLQYSDGVFSEEAKIEWQSSY